MKHVVVLLPSLPLLFALGCLEAPTSGELGNAEFAWNEGVFGCLLGCDLSEPMADRAYAEIRVTNSAQLPSFTVMSETPAVATFTQDPPGNDSSIEARAFQVGETRLILENASTQEVIDQVVVRVGSVDRIELNDEELYQDTYTVMEGGSTRIYFRLYDSASSELKGIGGLTYDLDGLEESEFTFATALANALVSALFGTIEHIDVEAHAVGSGSITATAQSGASRVIPIEVVGASAVTAVTLEAPPGQVGATTTVTATAYVGTEPVHSPECTWTIAPPDGPIQITAMTRTSITLTSLEAAMATVQCVVGSTNGQTSVSFVESTDS